jgi:hypothetical protein
MPKRNIRKSIPKRRLKRSPNRINTVRRRYSAAQRMAVHRRFVLFPNVTEAKWLTKLAWFSTIALKVLKMVVGINDDFTASEKSTGAGTAIMLGAGDFAATSPFAVPVTTTRTDKEVICLKAFPFERASLHHIHIKIVPSADVSVRGGMYAALIQPIDPVDAQNLIDSGEGNDLVKRYSYTYDDIIKHPRAKLGPVTSPLAINARLSPTPHSIRIKWDSNKGFCNAFPNCVLLVAFSDLAATESEVDKGYMPARSLFEVHVRGQIGLHDPSELTTLHDENNASMSCFTPKLMTSESASINAVSNMKYDLQFFDRRYTLDRPLDIRTLPKEHAVQMLQHYNRTDLMERLLQHYRDDNICKNLKGINMST